MLGIASLTMLYNTIQYNTKFVKRHVAVASEALKSKVAVRIFKKRLHSVNLDRFLTIT